MCESWAFDEINLNCGCPSTKVADRCFGARLMLVRVDVAAAAATDVYFPRPLFCANRLLHVGVLRACSSRHPFGTPSYRQWLVTSDKWLVTSALPTVFERRERLALWVGSRIPVPHDSLHQPL